METTQDLLETQVRAATGGTAYVIQGAPGCVEVRGKEGLDLLHRISTNDLEDLTSGSARETIFVDAKGRIVDLVMAGIQQERVILLCSAKGEEKLTNWIDQFIINEDVTLTSITNEFSIIKLVGVHAVSTASRLLESNIQRAATAVIKGNQGAVVVITNSGKRGDEVVLLVDGGGEGELGPQLVEQLNRLGAVEMQERAWEVYRIAQGIPLAGAELSEEFNPYDVGLVDLVSYTKGCYVGQEVIARLDTYQKAKRGLFGLRMSGQPIDLHPPIRLRKGDAEAGICTSLSGSLYGGEHLGLGVLRRDVVNEGDMLSMEGSAIRCRVSSIPMETTSG